MKKLFEYTKEQIIQVCKGMPLVHSAIKEKPLYIYTAYTENKHAYGPEPALYLSLDPEINDNGENTHKRYCSWFGIYSYNNPDCKEEYRTACEVKLHKFFNPAIVKDSSGKIRNRFELIKL